MRRIVCVGNRFVPDDSAGPEVHDLLAAGPLPGGVELVDGGLLGLGLLPVVDGAELVVFVDRLRGRDGGADVVVLSAEEAAGLGFGAGGHSAGLAYLLRILPQVAEGPLPSIHVVGVARPSAEAFREAARIGLLLARGEPGGAEAR